MDTARARETAVVELARPSFLDVGSLALLGFPAPHRPISVEQRPLDVQTFHDATAVSLPATGGGTRRKDAGAAYDSAGQLIVETERAKPLQGWWPTPRRLPETVRPEQKYGGRTLYGGRYVGHFGHILLETMTRFWADLDYEGYDQFLFVPKFFGRTKKPRSGLFTMLTELVGVPPEKVVVAGPDGVALETLDVPSAPFELAIGADPRFLDVFDRIADRTVREQYGGDLSALPKRIYLSRSQLDNGRPKGQQTAANETEAEAFFEGQGFAVIHPQKLPFAEQVALNRNAEVIAGCNGSALHLAMFSRPGTRLLALDIRHVGNQYLIDQARGLHAVHVWARTDDDEDWQTAWSIDMDRVRLGYDTVLAAG